MPRRVKSAALRGLGCMTGDTRTVRALRLMADYHCHPIWDAETSGNVDPSSLGISPELAAAPNAWGDRYTATLNQSDPLAAGFDDELSAEAWLRMGAYLADRLREEGFVVDYFDAERS